MLATTDSYVASYVACVSLVLSESSGNGKLTPNLQNIKPVPLSLPSKVDKEGPCQRASPEYRAHAKQSRPQPPFW